MSDNEPHLSMSEENSNGSINDENRSINKPNLSIDGQKEVHLKVSDHESSGDPSILHEPENKYSINNKKDPEISHVPEKKVEKKPESQCCLLI